LLVVSARLLVGALATATFSVIYSANVIAPLVTQMAAEFGVSVGTIGVVAAAYALPGIVTGALAGPFSDRHGRRPFLVGGASMVGFGTIASAFAPDLLTLTILRGVAGIGAATVLPNMMATVADHFGAERRARIISIVFLSNTLGGIVGITATGIVAQRFGWRVALALAGLFALSAAAATALAPLRRVPSANVAFLSGMRRVLTDRGALGLLASNYLGAMALQTWALYIVVFFERQYGLARDIASTYALVQGVGLLIGTQLGPSATGRLGARVSLAASLCGYGLILLSVTTVPLLLPLTVGACLLAAILYGLRATSNALLMTDQVPLARSTVFGLSATTVAAANATAATAGGVALDAVGFPAIGALCLVSAALSAALVMGLVREVVHRAGAATSGADPVIPTT
jgi:predicted MFS family arabinose efflux permease